MRGCVSLTALSMSRTMSHLKVQVEMIEGGGRGDPWDRLQSGHRKIPRNPVSNSWLSQPGGGGGEGLFDTHGGDPRL